MGCSGNLSRRAGEKKTRERGSQGVTIGNKDLRRDGTYGIQSPLRGIRTNKKENPGEEKTLRLQRKKRKLKLLWRRGSLTVTKGKNGVWLGKAR